MRMNLSTYNKHTNTVIVKEVQQIRHFQRAYFDIILLFILMKGYSPRLK